jgi:hypothetical protein
MTRAGNKWGIARDVWGALALFALLFGLGVPQGFMLAPTALGPTIVICTGHGAVVTKTDDRGAPAPAPKGKPAPTCPFAGHGGAPTTPAPMAVAQARFEHLVVQARKLSDLSPGRGLAAPPPPAQAPPIRLV